MSQICNKCSTEFSNIECYYCDEWKKNYLIATKENTNNVDIIKYI